jgi:hypothetical protein
MMASKIRDFAPLPYLSLEELVPKDNVNRRLDDGLDGISSPASPERSPQRSGASTSSKPVERPSKAPEPPSAPSGLVLSASPLNGF